MLTDQVFSLINFKFSQSNVLDKMLVKFKTGSSGVKNRSLGQIIASDGVNNLLSKPTPPTP